MRRIIIERLEDLFDQEVVDKMIGVVNNVADTGYCHYNSAMICVTFEDWDCIEYVEGYLKGYIGHAINVYTDSHGQRHYFDISQEYYVRKGLKPTFDTSFEVIKTFATEEIWDIFERDGATHLVEVNGINKEQAPQYMKDNWEYFQQMVNKKLGGTVVLDRRTEV